MITVYLCRLDEEKPYAIWEGCPVIPRVHETVVHPTTHEELTVFNVKWLGPTFVEVITL